VSVFYCHHCDKLIDSDYVECEEFEEELVCIDCYNELVGECGICGKETKDLYPDPRGISEDLCKGCEYEVTEKISAGEYN
jgi:hypothetical protein